MVIVPIIVGCLVLSVSFLIRAELSGNSNQKFFFKPLSIVLITILVVLSFLLNDVNNGFKILILIGMLLCMGGDIALLFDSSRAFLIGLVLFLCGHVAYTVAILKYGGFLLFGAIETPVITLIGLGVFFFVYSGLNRMKVPALVYMVVITLMANCALLTFKSDAFNSTQAWYLAIGACLFYLSDVMLAINKFKIPFRLNRISLAFYFSGQLLIALSTHHTALV